MTSSLPLSSLRLLIPPLRLVMAAMWRVVRQQSIKHYGMLEDFVSMVTDAVPQVLTDRQRSLLLLAFRVKLTLYDPEPQAIHGHLDSIRSISMATLDTDVSQWCSGLLTLTDKLIQSPSVRQHLLQEVFDHTFDSALQSVVSDFLSRLDQMFPVPDFKQAASLLDAAPSGVEECLQEVDWEILRELLTNQSCSQSQATTVVGCDPEKILLSVWSHPLFTKLTHPDTDTAVQSDPEPDWVGSMDLIKEEVVVMTENVMGQSSPPFKQEVSRESSEVGSDQCSVASLHQEVHRTKDSVEKCPDPDSQDPVDQSCQPCSEAPPSALCNISHNSQRVAHKCPRCSRCFIYRSQVIRHLRTNKSCGSVLRKVTAVNQQSSSPACHDEPRPPDSHPAKSHTCFQCDAIFKTKSELVSHQRTHRARPVYQCGQCDQEFHHLSSLTNHKQTHTEGGGFTCNRCDKVFGSAQERDIHRLHHSLPDLTCTVCDQTFSSQTLLLRHLQTHSAEGAEPQYTCRFCNQTFSGVTQLRIHQRSHTFRSYQCDQCSKAYGSLTGLQAHKASHSADNLFLCSQCGKRFKTREGLEGHLRTHTGERPYRCPYCSKDFRALAGLNVHVRRHTGERPYVCTVCGKGWPSGGDLQKHMRIHTGERPYTCEDCGKAFSISCHLTEHRRIHTGEKPFSCPECGKCLRRKFDLKKHMLSHSSVRPYACLYCPKSYTRKTHLSRHLLTHGVRGSDAITEPSDTA
ncbi:oocyte zinc finger protein XlCOF6-like [Thalassophryne amazonica]|uniref:oocyte zinc finger protein XlCOF6-like n=1 Tax=Thalassophryne amazonica TaxID=390379 RepID=UPI00147134B2|nr:oocyte zinc finger protein XlCOF6-like [Thalassophryne amazonica]